MKRNILLNALLTGFVLASLSFTTPDNTNAAISNTDTSTSTLIAEYEYILTGWASKKWSASSFTIAGFTQSCRLDDEFVFNVDGTYEYHAGEETCGDTSNDNYKTGNWQVDADGSSLTFDKGTDYEYTANIVMANNGSLELKGFYYLLPIRGKYIN